jgi:branched-chain amino acid transport system ATP-binding protein
MLTVRGLSLAYDGIVAVRALDLDIAAGERVAVIGANGAGKSTTLKGLAGLMRPRAGTIRLHGEDITARPAHDRVRRGISLVPEGRGVFARLTVAENLDMGAYLRADADLASDLERCYAMFPRLRERREQLAGTLSGGEQQMLAIARALMSRPALLLLDEPSMGLAPIVTARIFEAIADIAESGVAVLLVEQNARAALELADRGYVLESGEVTSTGPARDLLASAAVRQAYLGE